jgi:hypothetical protein
MITQIRIYNTARLLVQLLDTGAEGFAWQMMNERRQSGDVKGASFWLSIVAETNTLQHGAHICTQLDCCPS